ncbi:MAG: prepilin-type N-terminal cleavage/methylation domain-containing protein [Lentisphaerae bacterium]|nr:prepilin-type N-terminal cleavage/methylation domain-containing protein [Lentisphaerota bacterium]NMA47388.1 prepilin-type N-terminal cleavage/methylation domain-containing protein [Lentisphaerota bacterium]OQC12068.1 MAG: putative major pilin subunit [Lentisphaerae bacterium ADurb.Bin082]HPY89817.1 prepilin-type N-terminal cleavage/methylation domain-containing protein [Lentisphaeria bacterium]HQL87109.1 prepilin-type N-terminal cleavage/methylation domain-containing protein [Lentisphaeria 
MKQSDKQCKQRRGFTLVELMVVIVIIAVILGITAPAFRKLATGSAVDSAARMVSSQLSLARAEAISRRQHVAVIMPGADFVQDAANDTNIYRYQSFRAAIVEASATVGEYTFVQWIEGTDWTFLPTGALIIEADDDVDELTAATPHAPVGSGSTWTIGDGIIHEVNDGSSPAKIFDVASVTNNEVRAVVFKPNGRCASKVYVTIMEGVVATPTGNYERENMSNIRVMEINAYTGQIRFLF